MTQLRLWQNPKWPYFQWTSANLLEPLCQARFEQGWLTSKQDELHPRVQTLELKKLLPESQNHTELENFFSWWQNTPVTLDPILRAGVAFLWIYIIYDESENKLEIALPIIELSFQKDGFYLFSRRRFLTQLEQKYEPLATALNKCHNSSNDITAWLIFFIENISDNFTKTISLLKKLSLVSLNTRQKYILSTMITNQESFFTNKKYIELTFTSRESAKRDLADLVKIGLLKMSSAKGRSVIYTLD